jgi:hypothetical protein
VNEINGTLRKADKESGRLIIESQTLNVTASLFSISVLLKQYSVLRKVFYCRNPVRLALFSNWETKWFLFH